VRNIVQRSAVKVGSEQGFGVDEKVAHHCGPAGHAASISLGALWENLFGGRDPLACTFKILRGIVIK